MKRSVKKQFWFTREEAKELKRKSKKACLKEAGLIRALLNGYEPKEKPDDRFYYAMSQVTELSNRIEHLEQVVKVNGIDGVDLIRKEIERWHKFQVAIEKEFLCPEKEEQKWQ